MYPRLLPHGEYMSGEKGMLPEQRRAEIKAMILQHKVITVRSVADRLGVSTETVRRDFFFLEREGILERTRGGARIATLVSPGASNVELESVFVEEKVSIGALATRLVRMGACIFLDSSTTSLALARQLGPGPMTVASNSLAILYELAGRNDINLVAVGGTLSRRRRCFVGRTAREMLGDYFFDLVFLSCRSLDMIAGVTDSSDEEVEIKSTVAQRTNKLVLLADHSKFGRASFSRVCEIADLDNLITDQQPSEDWLEFLDECTVDVTWETARPHTPEDAPNDIPSAANGDVGDVQRAGDL